MQLLKADEQYLKNKGYSYELVPEGEGGCLIIKAFPLSPGKYLRDIVDLLIYIPKGYNDAVLDNYYVAPELRLKANNQYPPNTEHFEDHAGRRWQRFSRHIANWRMGIDTLKSFMTHIYRELQDKP